MLPRNIRTKVGLYLVVALSAAMVLFTTLVIRRQQNDLLTEASRRVLQTSDVIVKSTRHAMLLNERDLAEQIIRDIGKQPGIQRVRVISKDGTIIHSNQGREVGFSVEQSEEPCVQCHRSGKPLEHVPDELRWRIFQNSDGSRLLGTMQPIRNEPSCSSASCHEHPPGQAVLGIVDIAYSLVDIDASMGTQMAWIIAASAGLILLLATSAGLLLQRLIYVPLKDLEAGARRVAQGDFGAGIPVRSGDEFGRVAGAFNKMETAVRKSTEELQELVQTLEQKVRERTQELLVAEAEIAQGEKLASIGMLASGIAHELNNPLTGVLTFTSLLRKKMADGTDDAEDLDLVIGETRRCASIIRRLLDFAREKIPVKGYFDVNRLVEDTVRFVDRPMSLDKIEFATELEPGLPQLWGDADLIKQVLLNILVNAQQAIADKGTITVRTRLLPPPAGKSGPDAVPTIEVAVRDTGCGIPEANLQRIFDPFFTSKEVGKGTGLGLSVSYGIVRAHGGAIKVESTVGVGSTFRIQLPVLAPGKDAEPAEPAEAGGIATEAAR
jgi:two-component system NtrC family sensor kinase